LNDRRTTPANKRPGGCSQEKKEKTPPRQKNAFLDAGRYRSVVSKIRRARMQESTKSTTQTPEAETKTQRLTTHHRALSSLVEEPAAAFWAILLMLLL
jgi:hypothetical protein